MKIKVLNDDCKSIDLSVCRYDLQSHKEEDTKNGYYCVQEKYKIWFQGSFVILSDFILDSDDLHIYIYFDGCEDGRCKKLYNPSIEIRDEYIIVETIKSYQF